MTDYTYFKDALDGIEKPCAFLHMNALKNNISQIEANAHSKNIRIASKSIRSVEVLQFILSSSTIFKGLMCFTAKEALYLYEKGFNDLLIAYPIWDRTQLREILAALKQGAMITMMIDSMEHIERLESIALEEDGCFSVCIDIDMSSNFFGLHFGVHRSPINNVNAAVLLAQRIKQSSTTKLDGLMGYEAQIAGVTDKNPQQKLKSTIIRMLKFYSKKQLRQRRTQIIEAIKELGFELRFINGGGTGSLHSTIMEDNVTEVTVGSGFFNSHLFDKYKDFQYEPASGFAIEITRKPTDSIYTCFGGGYVASGAAGNDKLPEVYLPKGALFINNEGAGEVQTPIKYNGPIQLHHGDPIILRHSKAGEICERFQCLYIIENGKIIDTFSTYRGDGQCFL